MECEERKKAVYDYLGTRGIKYSKYDHEEAPTIEIARRLWHDDGSKHCKNLFFRNKKGDRHVHLFLDSNLRSEKSLSFHPNDNTSTVVISLGEFMRFLESAGNSYEFIDLY